MLRRSVKSVLYVLVSTLFVCIASSPASAQLQPRISPWMGMFDAPRGELGNYHTVVRPHQDLLRAQQAQTRQLRAQQQALQALQSGPAMGGGHGGPTAAARHLGLGGAAGGGGAAGMSSVGVVPLMPPREIPRTQRSPAGFNQYLHYYPPRSMPRHPVPSFSPVRR